MNRENYIKLTGAIFLVAGTIHVFRIVTGFNIVIASWQAPMWVSWVGALVGLYLGYTGLNLKK